MKYSIKGDVSFITFPNVIEFIVKNKCSIWVWTWVYVLLGLGIRLRFVWTISYAGCPGLRLEAESRLVHQMFISSPLHGGIRLFHFRDFVSLIVCCNFLHVDKLYSGWISYSEILYECVNNTILVWDPWHCVSTIFSQSFHITLPIWSQPWERNYWIKHST